jgi:hypothetical protein
MDGVLKQVKQCVCTAATRLSLLGKRCEFGAALLEGHEARLAKTNPKAKIVHYIGSGHKALTPYGRSSNASSQTSRVSFQKCYRLRREFCGPGAAHVC